MNPITEKLANTVGVVPLSDAAVLTLTGEDAVDFLHNQLTNDVKSLKPGMSRLAGYCTARGRMLATFINWRHDDILYLRTGVDIAAGLQKRLSMFVMRAKVKLALSELTAFGLVAQQASKVAELIGADITLPTEPYGVSSFAAGHLVRLPDMDELLRYELWLDPTQSADLIAKLQASSPALSALTLEDWHWLQLKTGIAEIVSGTQEKFVPQMVNFELVGGVNFKKGCYPGQEVVARSQYLGKLRRRSVLAQVAASAVAGAEVFSSLNEREATGTIVNAAPLPDNPQVYECLVETTMDSLNSSLHLGSLAGPVLSLQPMPYALDVDVTETRKL